MTAITAVLNHHFLSTAIQSIQQPILGSSRSGGGGCSRSPTFAPSQPAASWSSPCLCPPLDPWGGPPRLQALPVWHLQGTRVRLHQQALLQPDVLPPRWLLPHVSPLPSIYMSVSFTYSALPNTSYGPNRSNGDLFSQKLIIVTPKYKLRWVEMAKIYYIKSSYGSQKSQKLIIVTPK